MTRKGREKERVVHEEKGKENEDKGVLLPHPH